jgi:Trk K+ transport system NAD-binding subunit
MSETNASAIVSELQIHSKYRLLVAAARKQNSSDFVYNPDGAWVVEAGQPLIVLGKADDVIRAKEAAQV